MKKTIAILLTLMILSAIWVPAMAAASFADTAGKNCETATEVLAALGILEGKSEGAFEPESPLTRAEMVTIILRLMGMETATGGRDVFSDVPADHWAYGSITAAYDMEIVNGTSETTFSPDESVTRSQAVKMVVSALGYTVQAEAVGGYPAGYLSKAAQLDILAGVTTGEEMTRGDMAILVYNALDAELLLRTSYGEDAYTFESTETKTLLTYYLKAACVTDMVAATPMLSLLPTVPKLQKDEVLTAGGARLKVGETDAQDMAGVRADIYTRMAPDADVAEILAIVPRPSTETVELTAAEITDKTETEITYTDENGKEITAAVGDAALIYNGRVETDRQFLTNLRSGTVRLIANGGGYAYVIVEEYKNYIVDKVLAADKTLHFKNKGAASMVIDPEDTSIAMEMTDSTGAHITVEELIEWDVVSIAESRDGKVRRIRCSFREVQGKVTEVSDKEATIDGVVYPIADPVSVGTVQLGKTAAFFLDVTGAIAAVNEAYTKSGRYGWLVGAANTKGISGEPQLKIFTADGEMKVFSTVEKISLNGTVLNRSALLQPSLFAGVDLWSDGKETPLVDSAGQVVPQLLRYETNDAGEITAIDTAQNASDPTVTKTYGGGFSMDWYYHSPLDARLLTSTGESQIVEFNGTAAGNTAKQLASRNRNMRGIYFGNVLVDNATPFFVIPFDQSREEDYAIRSQSDFTYEAAQDSRCVAFYDIDDTYRCGAMVMHTYLDRGGSSDSYPGSTVAYGLVTARSNILSEDGEVLRSLKLFTAGGEVTVSFEEGDRALFGYTGSDIVADPDWYTTDGTNDTPVPFADDAAKAAFRQRVVTVGKSTMLPMYIKIDDLVPGDVIQYTVDPAGKLTMVSVLFRSAYPEYIEKAQGGSYGIMATTSVATYVDGASTLTLNGIVKECYGHGLMVETYPVNSKGEKQSTPFLRTLPVYGDYYLVDSKKDEIKKVTASDAVEGDELFTYWSTNSQKITVIYRK